MISPVVYYMSLSREGADSNKPLRFKFELPRQKNTYKYNLHHLRPSTPIFLCMQCIECLNFAWQINELN